MTQIPYPQTRRDDTHDTLFGETVADPYRWLEADVRNDAGVAEWVGEQSRTTEAYLASLPQRDVFAARIRALFDHERFGVPVRKGGRYFFSHNTGLQRQSVLWLRDSLDGEGRVLIDPNGWSQDGATALSEWLPSEDGSKLLYGIQDGGSDWRKARVRDLETGEDLPETLEWMKYSLGASWAKDGSGFFYSRYPQPPAGEEFQAITQDHAVYFHRLGTPQAEDRLIYATPEQPTWSHYAGVTDDGDWLVVTTYEGTDNRYRITLIDLTRPEAAPRTVVPALENMWSYAGNQGTRFLWVTDRAAPRGRIVAMDVASAEAGPDTVEELVAEQDATLEGAGLVGGALIASYLVDARTEIRRFAPDGTPSATAIDLPGIGTASGFGGTAADTETFYAFTSFNYPTTIFRYDIASGESTVWAQPQVAFDPADFVVEQRFFASKDGTKVPMFVLRKAGASGPAPTLLYGYGGFNISLTPNFAGSRLAWVEAGGVYAVVNLRGGGEYGKAWHDGGRRANKQNSFDDFIAAGEYLIAEGITAKDGLGIQGGSNGGLLVGAVTNQRPDLVASAVPQVGVMDMLRFNRFTAGRYWVDDYGHPDREEDFRVLRAYSPYHNVREGVHYPAVLVTTADTDDRVVPGHSFKYAAALQSAEIGPRPHLIRIETRAGHGAGKPIDKAIEEAADVLAFTAQWTGLDVSGSVAAD
nr:prolyl oligopeptidase family serine peptidase [Novosphingobium sp. 9]